MKVCKAYRGLPGSGKSTLARLSAWAATSRGYRARIVSADEYFYRPDGKYAWHGEELAAAHEWAREMLGKAVRSGCDLVIIDNCNIKHRDFESYREIALAAGYDFSTEVVGKMPASEEELIQYAARNCHGVPLEGIRRMNAKWEP